MSVKTAAGVVALLALSAVLAHAQARITASATDSNGNVYVTGWRAVVAGSQYEMATTKYDMNGVRQWTHAYPDDPARPDAESWGIAVDPSGNVYVAGHVGTAANVDCLLIKYAADYVQGNQPEWVRTYDGGANDQNWTIAVDPGGYVYVTGYSVQSHAGVLSSDFATMKYDSRGTMVWGTPRFYNGPADSYDHAFAIAVDPVTGNVYVTGAGQGAGTSQDIVTIMYDSRGKEMWVRRSSGTVINGISRGTSLALDAQGSVYVAGWSQGTTTVGNVDFATTKYDVRGHEIWAARYDGPAGSNDQPAPPAGRGGGSAYFGNYVQNNQGIIVTTEPFDPVAEVESLIARVSGLDVDPDVVAGLLAKLNNCLGSLLSDNADVRQNALEVLGAFINELRDLTAQSLVPSDEASELTALATQIVNGNTVVYVAGQSTGVGTNVDFAVIKYRAADGRPVWNLPGQPGTTPASPGNPPDVALRYDGLANNVDRVWAMAQDLDGNIYLTGPSMATTARSVDYFTIKYFVKTDQPVVLGEGRYDGPGGKVDQSCGFATWRDPATGRQYIFRDPATGQDYVVVTGNSIAAPVPPATTGVQEYATVTYNGALVQQWVQRYYW